VRQVGYLKRLIFCFAVNNQTALPLC